MRTFLEKKLGPKDKGFTLIELLVVIVIIGILAAIAIPVFLKQREKANDASLKADLKNVATAVETAFVDLGTGVFPAALPADAKITAGNTVTYTVDSVGVTTGKAYCLKGTSSGSSKDWYYDSDNGGLLAGAATC